MSFDVTENQWGERFIESIHRTTLVKRSYQQTCERKPITDFSQPDTLFIVIGSDSGLLLSCVENGGIGNGSRVVLIEPDEVYDFLVARDEFRDFLPAFSPDAQIGLYSQSNWYAEVFDDSDFRWFFAGQVGIAEAHCSQSDYLQIYTPLLVETRRLVNRRRYENNVKVAHKIFIDIQIQNAADNQSPMLRSESFGQDRTAVVLGGGPSVDEHIDWIMTHRDQVFLITVSRLSQRLQELEIKPDLVVNIDPYPYSYEASKHGLLWDDVALASSYHAATQLMQQWRGPSFYLGDRLPWQRFDGIDNSETISAAGPTVGHTCIIVASQLGFSQILLSGMDHCYNEQLNTHSEGQPESQFHKLPILYDAQIETYSGRIAGTQEALLIGIKPLEQLGESINAYTPVLFNLSANAAKIDSIPFKSVDEVELPNAKPDIAQLIAAYTCTNPQADLNVINKEVKQAARQFRQIIRLCQRASAYIDQIYLNDIEDPSQKPYKNLDKLEQILSRRFKSLMALIRRYSVNEFTATQRPSGFSEMDDAEKEQWIRQYYYIIKISADHFLHVLDSVSNRIDLRMLEHSESPDFKKLHARWIEDGTPGRTLRYCNMASSDDTTSPTSTCASLHPALEQESPAVQKLFQETAMSFLDEVANDNRMVYSTLKSLENITQIIRSVLFLFNTKSVDDLKVLSSNLDADTWPSVVLSPFCNGLVAELESRPEQAAREYQIVADLCGERLESGTSDLESMQRLIEETLARMTQSYLTLKDYASACTSLGMLCEISPQYILSYARLLNLTGNPEPATELLTTYLENYPNHWQAATLMADIYEAMGDTGKASEANQLSLSIRDGLNHNNESLQAHDKAA